MEQGVAAKEGLEKQEKSLLRRGSFISFDPNSKSAYYFFKNNMGPEIKGLCITRTHPSVVRNENPEEFDIVWMNQKKFKKSVDLFEHLEKTIKNFLKKSKKSVIILERIDYLVNIYGFQKFLNFIYNLNDEIFENNSSLIVHSNPHILNEREKSLLHLEMQKLPRPEFIEKIKLAKDLYDILEFIKDSETKVSFKNICKKFNITKATTRKRIYELQSKNFILIKKDGRSKIVELTPESQNLI